MRCVKEDQVRRARLAGTPQKWGGRSHSCGDGGGDGRRGCLLASCLPTWMTGAQPAVTIRPGEREGDWSGGGGGGVSQNGRGRWASKGVEGRRRGASTVVCRAYHACRAERAEQGCMSCVECCWASNGRQKRLTLDLDLVLPSASIQMYSAIRLPFCSSFMYLRSCRRKKSQRLLLLSGGSHIEMWSGCDLQSPSWR